MKAIPKQYTLGSLMVVIAALAGLLAVPKETWGSIAQWALNGVALFLLGLVGFGLGHAGSKLAVGLNGPLGGPNPEKRPEPIESGTPPCPPT